MASKDEVILNWFASFEVFLYANEMSIASVIRMDDGTWRTALRKNGEHNNHVMARGESLLLSFMNVHERAKGTLGIRG